MAATLPPWPTLKLGNSGKNIYALQYLLGYNGIPTQISGTFDGQTQTAVTQFQTRHNIKSDAAGVAGKGTLPKLVVSVQQVQPKEGEQIPATNSARAAQYLLSKFESLTIDGKFGPGAATALAAFQVRMRISITGIADSLTWQYMFRYGDHRLPSRCPAPEGPVAAEPEEPVRVRYTGSYCDLWRHNESCLRSYADQRPGLKVIRTYYLRFYHGLRTGCHNLAVPMVRGETHAGEAGSVQGKVWADGVTAAEIHIDICCSNSFS